MEAIGREYMDRLGYGDQPYIIFRHDDNARPHIHIVSLRIDEQGRKLRDYKEWERSTDICRELERNGMENCCCTDSGITIDFTQ